MITIGGKSFTPEWLDKNVDAARGIYRKASDEATEILCNCVTPPIPMHVVAGGFLRTNPGHKDRHSQACPYRAHASSPSPSDSLDEFSAQLIASSGLLEWAPQFAGKRRYPVVRKLILDAAPALSLHGKKVGDGIFMPPVFSADDPTDVITDLRSRLAASPLVVFAFEAKSVVAPAGRGHLIAAKHVPNGLFWAWPNATSAVDPISRGLADGQQRALCISTLAPSTGAHLGISDMSVSFFNRDWSPRK